MKNKKTLLIVLALICLVLMCACSNEITKNETPQVEEETNNGIYGNIAVYRTYEDGRKINDYPSNIFVNDEIINKITNSTGIGPINDENPGIIFVVEYHTSGKHLNQLLIERNGTASKMVDGLKYNTFYLTGDELTDLVRMLA